MSKVKFKNVEYKIHGTKKVVSDYAKEDQLKLGTDGIKVFQVCHAGSPKEV
jgi:hypothetical protein